MKLLLDTHIIVWSVAEPKRLAPRVRRALENRRNELWMSPVTAWELLLLFETGRLRSDIPFDRWLAEATTALALEEAPLVTEVVLAAREIALPHSDPADRLLAATARWYDLKLVTADERLLQGSGFETLSR